MLKKIALNFCLIITVITFFQISACKRGEEDPFSVLPRIQRLKGEWKLTAYSREYKESLETMTSFSSTACDTGQIAGTVINKLILQENYKDTLLNTVVNDTQEGIGNTNTYDIRLTYNMDLTHGGNYKCTGSYTFYDVEKKANFTGNFKSETNSWFWEDSGKSKVALTFTHFPIIDVGNIKETGTPIRFIPFYTFEVLKLSKDELKLKKEELELNTTSQSSDPFVIPAQSPEEFDINNCVKSIDIVQDLNANSEWFFEKIIEETE